MVKFLKDFWYEEDAMGTVEIVIIIAVLVAIAIIFKDTIIKFAQNLMKNVFNSENVTKSKTDGGGSVY